MKPLFNNLNDALTYHLEGLHDAEKKLQVSIPKVIAQVKSAELKDVLEDYAAGAADKRIKLKRAFSYLLTGPFGRKNKVMSEMILELASVSKKTSVREIKEAMLGNCLSTIVHFKISCYASAMTFALALELHPVADLISETLQWERKTDLELTKVLGKINSRAAKQASGK